MSDQRFDDSGESLADAPVASAPEAPSLEIPASEVPDVPVGEGAVLLPEDDLDEVAAQIADQVEAFLLALREVADVGRPESGISHLLLGVSQILAAGGRLGALADVVPDERFEPDPGYDPDVDLVRERLADLLGDSDEYLEIFDPYDVDARPVRMRISGDLADVATHLLHGLQHAHAGRFREALWWWQFSYLSSWGSTSAAVLRALQSLVAHDRFDPRDPSVVDVEDQLVAEVFSEVVGADAVEDELADIAR
jgi:hypothetical protein